MTFDDAFAKVVGIEGGYVNNPADPGGETKFGISKRAYPGEDIKSLTLDRAKELYKRDYWGPAGCDAFPDPLRYLVFDAAVNSGVKQAVMLLQLAAGEVVDGKLGPMTLQAVQGIPVLRVCARFMGRRLDFMNDQKSWATFGKGWAQRVAELLEQL